MLELDATSTLWIVGILGILLGISLGSIVTSTLGNRNRNRHNEDLQSELDQLGKQFVEYREQVSKHFMHTSDLVQEMTRSYRAVYEHLATGAYHLCSDPSDTPTLGHQSAEIKPAAAPPAPADAEYDELAELSSLREDIDSLLKDSPRFRDVDVGMEDEDRESMKH